MGEERVIVIVLELANKTVNSQQKIEASKLSDPLYL